jgi:membrane protein required for colicin V production
MELLNQFGTFDLVIIFFIGFSTLVGLSRGLSGEIASFIKIIGAVIIAIYIVPIIKPSISELISNDLIATIIALIGTYITAIILLKIISSQLEFLLTQIIPHIINKPFGMAFGFLKSLVICCLIYFIIISIHTNLMKKDEKPQWLESSRTIPFLDLSTRAILTILPNIEYSEDNIAINNIFSNLASEKEETNKESKKPKSKLTDSLKKYQMLQKFLNKNKEKDPNQQQEQHSPSQEPNTDSKNNQLEELKKLVPTEMLDNLLENLPTDAKDLEGFENLLDLLKNE